jgi:hypothetical protein
MNNEIRSRTIGPMAEGSRYVDVDGKVVHITTSAQVECDDLVMRRCFWDNSNPDRLYHFTGKGNGHCKHLCRVLICDEDLPDAIEQIARARSAAKLVSSTEDQLDCMTHGYAMGDSSWIPRSKKGRVLFLDARGHLSVSSGDYTEKEFRERCSSYGWKFIRVLTEVPEFSVVEVYGE